MVGLKASEGKQATMTPSPKKKDKSFKKLKADTPSKIGQKAFSPAVIKKEANTPAKSSNGAEIKKKTATPAKSSNGAGKKNSPIPAAKPSNGKADSKKKKFGKYGPRNALKAKDDVFKKMITEEAVKEHLSPSFLKKLDKCVARLPPAGKRFIHWLIYDVKYKIKFLPIVEEVFQLIKDMKVLPLPSSGQPPKTSKEKKKEKQLRYKEKRLSGAGGGSASANDTSTPKKDKSEKRKISEVTGAQESKVETPEGGKKKKKIKTENVSMLEGTGSDAEIPDPSFSLNESSPGLSEKKKKRKRKSLGKPSD